jgi:hypothetical protein
MPRGYYTTARVAYSNYKALTFLEPPLFTSGMGLDAVAVVRLVLGVLGLFGISWTSERIWRALVCGDQNLDARLLVLCRKSRRFSRRRNETLLEEGLPMTSIATQVRIRDSSIGSPFTNPGLCSHSKGASTVATNQTTRPMIVTHICIGPPGCSTSSNSHVGCPAGGQVQHIRPLRSP